MKEQPDKCNAAAGWQSCADMVCDGCRHSKEYARKYNKANKKGPKYIIRP